MNFYKRNYIEGLFLSSGIIQSADYTMEQLILVAKTLREREKFGGYIHLKAVPGASKDLLLEAGKYADRLSANIELPVQTDLDILAPEKTVSEIEKTMSDVKFGIDDAKDLTKRNGDKPTFARAGQSTQLVVGASDSSDTVILTKAQQLYNDFKLRRVYYSAFSPAAQTTATLRVRPTTPPMREHRLYEADWLIRNYGFASHEITNGLEGGNLDLEKDPKLAWALRHRHMFPVDVNRASKSLLLRVPGLGIKSVNRIVSTRRFHRIKLDDLIRLKASMNRAKWFVVTADHNPDVFKLDRADLPSVFHKKIEQPMLFAPPAILPVSVISGEL
jgi:putative DNA modification/repair radical SAM protein